MSESTAAAQVEEVMASAMAELEATVDLERLEGWRVSYLGRRGKLTQILRGLGGLSPNERRAVGAAANRLKTLLEDSLDNREAAIKQAASEGNSDKNAIDVTLPGWPAAQGGLHPTTKIVREILGVFHSMGFQVAEGPEVEWDRYNFEMLNIPKEHPARDAFNTLWVDYYDENGEMPMLLRTHTSPVQGRYMEQNKPPIRIVSPGNSYRYEATDATHEWQFTQIEGLAVDRGITFANLKGTLFEFARRIFGQERKVRFRCDFFPFVEPGVDMSIDCFSCEGKGCRICSDTGWIEIMGAGMVHPKVLEAAGLDPYIYTGFAFGMGPERIAMLKYGIDDIRLFHANDLRFLKQF
jgi:phenylalanyl-tRNA synthetase alpha chain